MGLFSRLGRGRRRQTPEEAIVDFWTWWPSVASSYADAVDESRFDELIEGISAHVDAIDGSLAWELAPAEQARHCLTVTAGGDPELRATARRWLRLAPPSGPDWEFSDLRTPSSLDCVLEIHGVKVDLSLARVGIDDLGNGLGVTMFHPAFARMEPDACRQVAGLALDTAIGERRTELWTEWLEIAEAAPTPSEGLDALVRAADSLEQRLVHDGTMGEAVLAATSDGGPVTLVCLHRLASVQAPSLDRHVELAFDYPVAASGIPEDDIDVTEELVDRLRDAMESGGLIVARSYAGGRLTVHAYVDATSDDEQKLREAAAAWPGGPRGITAEHDPAWDAVQQFRH